MKRHLTGVDHDMKLINRRPSPWANMVLGSILFVLVLIVYLVASHYRLEANPSDKLLPSLQTMIDTMSRMAFEPDRRSGNYLLWTDTAVSLMRLAAGLAISALIAVFIGIAMGTLPYARSFFAPFVETFSLIPPITILPILFIVFGLNSIVRTIGPRCLRMRVHSMWY